MYVHYFHLYFCMLNLFCQPWVAIGSWVHFRTHWRLSRRWTGSVTFESLRNKTTKSRESSESSEVHILIRLWEIDEERRLRDLVFLAAPLRCGKAILFSGLEWIIFKVCFILFDDHRHDGRREFCGKYTELWYARSESYFTVPSKVSENSY